MFRYEVNPPVSSEDLNHLFAESWPKHESTDFDKILERALIYICAYHDAELIGFAKLISDGGVHAFLLDPTVTPTFRRQGHAKEMVKCLKVEAKSHGLEWIHVDYEPHLKSFYEACGFNPTEAGVCKLR